MTAEQLAEAAGLRYGVELEFVGPPFPNVHQAIRRAVDPHELIRAHRHTEKLTAWAHDTETCIYPAPGQGTGQEVKTRLNATEDEIRAVVSTLRDTKCSLTRHCGMHVHISHPRRKVRARLPRTEIWPERLREVGPKTSDYEPSYWTRGYGVAQITPTHVEVRVFNSTLDPDLAVANLRLALASVHHDGENDWESVPIAAMTRREPAGV
jgi:hypothetical protein